MTPPVILSQSEAPGDRRAVVVSVRPGLRVTVIASPDADPELVALVASAVATGTPLVARHGKADT